MITVKLSYLTVIRLMPGLIFFMMMVISACGTGAVQHKTHGSVPDWVHSPGFKGGYYLGVGYSNGRRTISEAKKEAVENGKVKLAEMMESNVSSDIKVYHESVEGGKESYSEKGVMEEIDVKTNVRLNDVVVDKVYFLKDQHGGYEYFVLVKMSKRQFDKEMKRLEKIYFDKLESVDGRLKAGKRLIDKGRVGEALEQYIAAAINSAKLPNAKSRFDSIVLLIQKTLGNIRFKRINDRQKGTIKKGLAKPIRVKVSYRLNDRWIAVRKTRLRFFIRKNPGSQYSRTGLTSDMGMAECRVTSFKRGGRDVRLVVRLDLRKSLEAFDVLLDEKWRSKKAMVEEWMDEKKTIFHFMVGSPFRSESSALIVSVRGFKMATVRKSLSVPVFLKELKSRQVSRAKNVEMPNAKDLNTRAILKHCLSLKMKKAYVVEMKASRKTIDGREFLMIRGKIRLLDVKTGKLFARATSSQSVSLAKSKSTTALRRTIDKVMSRVAAKLVRNLFNRL